MSYPGDAYVAGLMDGEGCIWIAKRMKKKSGSVTYSTVVTVGMTRKAFPVLNMLSREFGGTVTLSRKATEKWEEARAWTLSGLRTKEFLRRMEPLLQLKAEQARLGLRLEEIHESLPGVQNGKAVWTDETRERCEKIRCRVMELNAKGPQRLPHVPEKAVPVAQLVAGEWHGMDPSLFSDLGFLPFSGPWPKSGIMSAGIAYRLPGPERPISVNGFSLLPTPTARDWKGIPGKDVQMASLPREIAMLAGEYTWRRSATGKASTDDQHLFPPSPEEPGTA